MSSVDDLNDISLDLFNESNQFLSFSFQDFLQHIFNFSFVFVEKFSNDHSCVSFGVQPVNEFLPQVIEEAFQLLFIVHHINIDMATLNDLNDISFDVINKFDQFLSFSLQDLLQHVVYFSLVFIQEFGSNLPDVAMFVKPVNDCVPEVIEWVGQCKLFIVHRFNIDMSSVDDLNDISFDLFNESNQFLSFSFQDFRQHIFNFSFVFVEKFSDDHSCVSFG